MTTQYMNNNSQSKAAGMKYKMTDETTEVDGKTLYKIEALIDIDSVEVKAGDKGGFIESEKNLSQEGDCWVDGNAKVSGNAWVAGNAQVSGSTVVSGDAKVPSNAKKQEAAW